MVAGTVDAGATPTVVTTVVLAGAATVVASVTTEEEPESAEAIVPADSTSPARTPVAVDGGVAVRTGVVASGTAEPTTVGAAAFVELDALDDAVAITGCDGSGGAA